MALPSRYLTRNEGLPTHTVRTTPEGALRVRALAGDIVLCFFGKILTVPLSTQVYKWVPANLLLGDKPAMD